MLPTWKITYGFIGEYGEHVEIVYGESLRAAQQNLLTAVATENGHDRANLLVFYDGWRLTHPNDPPIQWNRYEVKP